MIVRLIAIASLLLVSCSAVAADKGSGSPKKKCRLCPEQSAYKIDYAKQSFDGSETIRGPRKIVVTNLNVLRYGYKLGAAVTIKAGPSLDLASLAGSGSTSTTSSPSTPATKANAQLADAAKPPAKPAGGQFQANVAEGRKGGTTRQPHPDYLQEANNFARQIQEGLAPSTHAINEANRVVSSIKTSQGTVNGFVAQTNQATATISTAKSSLQNLLIVTDAILQNGSEADYANAIEQELSSPAFLQGVQGWVPQDQITTEKAKIAKISADAANVSGLLEDNRKTVALLAKQTADELQTASAQGWGPDAVSVVQIAASAVSEMTVNLADAQTHFQPVSGDLSKLSTTLDSIAEGSDKQTAFANLMATLSQWKLILESVHSAVTDYVSRKSEEDPLSRTLYASCEFAFGGTKSIAVSLTQTSDGYFDLTGSQTNSSGTPSKGSSKTSTPQGGSAAPQKLVTVECTTPFVITAGVAFSSIPNREFGIQQIGTTTNPNGTSSPNNIFVSTVDSRFHPLPLAMIHARLCEYGNKISLHGSVGIAANIKGQNSGGSYPEYLIGPSIGFFRSVFVTPGVHIGTSTKLGAPYRVGDTVPTNITTPPLQTSYKVGFGLAFTFAKN